MYKKFLNFMLRLQANQGLSFRFILSCNELYIKFIKFFIKPKITAGGYSRAFSVKGEEFIIKRLTIDNLNDLYEFFRYSIDTNSPCFHMPHKTDLKALRTIFGLASHIPLGIFYEDTFIGYALIRLFFPNKGSYAIFIADKCQGRGIGTAALEKQLGLIRELGFVPCSAVSKNNKRSLGMLKKLKIEFSSDLGDCFEVKDVM